MRSAVYATLLRLRNDMQCCFDGLEADYKVDDLRMQVKGAGSAYY